MCSVTLKIFIKEESQKTDPDALVKKSKGTVTPVPPGMTKEREIRLFTKPLILTDERHNMLAPIGMSCAQSIEKELLEVQNCIYVSF